MIDGNLSAIPESKAMYSKHWQSLQTGEMLLKIGLPGIVENATVAVIKEPPAPKERIYETRVASLKMIPSAPLVLNAYSELLSGKGWGIYVAGIGKFAASAVKLLPEAAYTVTFVDKVKEMLSWMARESDAAFADWFHSILQDTPG